ncbi:nucleoid-associated protein YgaU [Sphingomonas sp. BE270]|uniref:hypothetical protein n=1 Tax=Sphingomonas sp. BE270 TaxID=2817726 RepID=UPI0028662240|nr:hypothetical protein [Sphingomonas sp. BE270]MDR7257778.1 nucleoid-associated protein YgaU [Sphingomonas sp. BE270]
MSDTTVQLGDFVFGRFETPEMIPFGGDQKLIVHELVGGRRVIDAMGEVPLALEWSGFLIGASALDRALYLDGMRKAGLSQALTWSELSYSVVVKSLRCEFVRSYRIPYHITCEVSADNTAPITTITLPSFEQAVADDEAKAAELAATLGNGSLISAVSSISSALAAINNGVGAAQSAINSVLLPIAAARDQIAGLMQQTGAILQGVATVGGIVPYNPLVGQVANLIGQMGAMDDQPILLTLDRTLGRMANNLGSINSGTKGITVAGGNLYSIAADQYGDAMGWTALAVANRLSDPQVVGVNTIIVPPFTDNTGGILNA